VSGFVRITQMFEEHSFGKTGGQSKGREEKMATPYDREDAARDTGVTDKEVSEAWHEARESA